jgi:hypothetical protein
VKASVRFVVAGAIVAGLVGGWWLASKPTAAVAPRALERVVSTRTSVALPDATTTPANASVIGEQPVDALQAYVALRDDVNPKPRLRLIEDWSRARAPGASLDLLTQAMVDPDEAVRARAQDLFERGLAADARREHGSLTTLSD